MCIVHVPSYPAVAFLHGRARVGSSTFKYNNAIFFPKTVEWLFPTPRMRITIRTLGSLDLQSWSSALGLLPFVLYQTLCSQHSSHPCFLAVLWSRNLPWHPSLIPHILFSLLLQETPVLVQISNITSWMQPLWNPILFLFPCQIPTSLPTASLQRSYHSFIHICT